MTGITELSAAVITGVPVLVGGRWAFLPRHHLPRNRVRDLQLRLHLRLHPGRGHATVFELWWKWGRLASYRESRRTRPDLPRLSRLAHPAAHSIFLGTAQWRREIRASIQLGGAVIGPPRSGKSALMSRITMTAPGAVVVTSSKPDIFALTSGVRAGRGPIWVFNPMKIGGIVSNVRWDPLAECDDPAIAIRRADAFAAAARTDGTDESSFWSAKASDALRGMFTAAALRNDSMRRVAAWVGGQHVHEAIDTLTAAGRDEWAGQLANDMTGSAEKTTSTIKMVLSRAMSWMLNPDIAAACLPGPGQQFDIDDFLLSGGTLYLLARTDTEDNVLGPLFAALVGEIHERALQLASRMKYGRLQPPLTMVLDEVTRIAPVPLPAWGADSAGQGILIWSAFQSLAQLRSRWGRDGAQTVLDTSTVKIVMPGVTDPELLDHISKLCGRVSYRQHKADESWQFTEAMSESMIRQLPDGFALIIRANCAVLISRLAAGWNYRPFRRLDKAGLAVATITPVSEPLVLGGADVIILDDRKNREVAREADDPQADDPQTEGGQP